MDKEKIDLFWQKVNPTEQSRIMAKARWEQMPWLSILIEWPSLIPKRLKKDWDEMRGESAEESV